MNIIYHNAPIKTALYFAVEKAKLEILKILKMKILIKKLKVYVALNQNNNIL